MSESHSNPIIPEDDSPSLAPAERAEASAEVAPVAEATATEASTEAAPVAEATATEASAEVAPVAEAPATEASAEVAPVAEATATEASAEAAPAEESTKAEIPAEEPKADVPPQTTYRWTYADQVHHDSKKSTRKKRSGVLVYSLVMSLVFLISFSMLIGVLILGSLQGGMNFGGSDAPSILRPGISDPADDDEAVVGVEQAKHSVVVIEVQTASGGGSGTGIILSEDGYIATNHHVIEDGKRIKVSFYDGSYAYAEIVGSSEIDDLAVIKVNKSGLTAATFARSEECYVGQTVYAIGAPAGPEFGWTTTRGIVSYKDREVKMYDDDGSLQKKLRLIQTDANVNPGNSGGPLINAKGEVLGVVTLKLADGYEGIGFAIPSDGAVEILEAIMEHGHANDINSSVSHKRPMMGISGIYMTGGVYYKFTDTGASAIPDEELGQHNIKDLYRPPVSGVYVVSVTKGLDAEKKLKVGDIITAIDGDDLFSMDDLTGAILDHYAGDTVTLTVYRGGQYKEIKVLLSAA